MVRNNTWIIKHWRGKFSCPMCGEFHKDESWFMVDHMMRIHAKEEIINCLFSSIVSEAMGEKSWVIDDC